MEACSFEPVDRVDVNRRERRSAECVCVRVCVCAEVGHEEGEESLKAEP